jgi:UDP-N-acetylmuramate--alanine ligase
MTRAFSEIGRGLDPVRPARPIRPGERLHVIGVGGAAAAGACLLADAAGATVTGCDAGGPNPYDRPAEARGISIAWRHDPAHVATATGPSVDRVAVTKALTSVEPDHPELVAARAAGIPLESVQQVIADAAATGGRRLIGVTGTHGKSTTSGWLVHLLVEAGRDPAAFVGALLAPALVGGPLASTARLGTGPEFVVEADEYAGNFEPYRAAIGVAIAIEWDHPDVFADEAAIVATIEAWVRNFEAVEGPPVLVANVGDAGVRRLVGRLANWPGRIVAVELVDGRDGDPAARAAELSAGFGSATGPAMPIVARATRADGAGSGLEIAGLAGADGPIAATTGLVGRHMAIDGLLAAAAASVAGADPASIARGLASFGGVGRRMELKGDVGGVVVLDDYGHHPTAIAATFAAVRLRYPDRRLWAVYEPLTYHRTAAMLDAFAAVLASAERVAIVDIWAVRDLDTTSVSAADLAAATDALGTPAIATGPPEASAERLAGLVEPGDVVLVMGGGRSYVVAEQLVERLAARTWTGMDD